MPLPCSALFRPDPVEHRWAPHGTSRCPWWTPARAVCYRVEPVSAPAHRAGITQSARIAFARGDEHVRVDHVTRAIDRKRVEAVVAPRVDPPRALRPHQ